MPFLRNSRATEATLKKTIRDSGVGRKEAPMYSRTVASLEERNTVSGSVTVEANRATTPMVPVSTRAVRQMAPKIRKNCLRLLAGSFP